MSGTSASGVTGRISPLPAAGPGREEPRQDLLPPPPPLQTLHKLSPAPWLIYSYEECEKSCGDLQLLLLY